MVFTKSKIHTKRDFKERFRYLGQKDSSNLIQLAHTENFLIYWPKFVTSKTINRMQQCKLILNFELLDRRLLKFGIYTNVFVNAKQ